MVTIYSNNYLRNGSLVSKTVKNPRISDSVAGTEHLKINTLFYIKSQDQVHSERYFKKHMDFKYEKPSPFENFNFSINFSTTKAYS